MATIRPDTASVEGMPICAGNIVNSQNAVAARAKPKNWRRRIIQVPGRGM